MKNTLLTLTTLLFVLLSAPAAMAGQETTVAAAVGGVYPAGTSFEGISISGLEAGLGLEIEDGQALGELCVLLLGTTVLGVPQTIVVEGKATAGVHSATNTATFSGTASVIIGTAPPVIGVPFTVTMAVDANAQGALGLVIGNTTLPDATINAGSMTISVPDTATPVLTTTPVTTQ